jgi:hypothetical protein
LANYKVYPNFISNATVWGVQQKVKQQLVFGKKLINKLYCVEVKVFVDSICELLKLVSTNSQVYHACLIDI